MSCQHSRSDHPYLPWREKKLKFTVSGEGVFCETLFGDEEQSREIRIEGLTISLSFPLGNRDGIIAP